MIPALLLVETEDVAAGELVVALGPRADLRQARSKVPRDDVFRPADEDGPVAEPWEELNLLDLFGVVVRGQRSFAFAKGGHRHPGDDVRQPGVGRRLQLWILVQEIVDLP